MAKISARGAHEVARLRTTRTIACGSRDMVCEDLWVVRSDRKLLHRSAKIDGRSTSGSYSITGTLSEASMADAVAVITRFVTRRGYIII